MIFSQSQKIFQRYLAKLAVYGLGLFGSFVSANSTKNSAIQKETFTTICLAANIHCIYWLHTRRLVLFTLQPLTCALSRQGDMHPIQLPWLSSNPFESSLSLGTHPWFGLYSTSYGEWL